MAKYKSNFRPNDYIQQGQYSPQQIGSSANALREEQGRNDSQDRAYLAQIKENQAQERENIQTETANDVQVFKDMESLGKFSQKLASDLVEIQGKRNEAAQERGLAKAYEDGLPAEQMAAFDEQEQELIGIDTAGKKAAMAAQDRGMGASTANQIRKLSGWEGYGYAQGMAIQGGLAYGSFFEQSKKNAKITVEGEDGQMREITYDSAETVAEREAVGAAIRQQYMRNFTGMKPELLNKYLFPQMKRSEAAIAAQWDKDQELKLEQKRKDEAVSFLQSQVQAGAGGGAVLQVLDQFEGDFGGPQKTREFVKTTLQGLIDNNIIDQNQAQQILTHRFKNRAGQWTTIQDQFPIEFGGLRRSAIKAEQTRLETEDLVRKNQSNEYKLQVREAELERRANGKGAFSKEDIRRFEQTHKEQIGGPTPEWLKDMASRESESDEAIEERLELLKASRPGGYLLESDLAGASPKLYNEHKGDIVKSPLLGQFKTEVQNGEEMVTTLIRSAAGLTGDSKITDNKYALMAEQRGVVEFRNKFATNLKSMPPDKAYSEAIKYMEGRLTIPVGKTLDQLPILGKIPEDKKSFITNQVALEAVGKDENIIKTGVIPGTARELEQLVKYAETGTGSIPEVYRAIAANSNGTLTAWDVAQSQLQATGKGTMLRLPKVEQAVQEMDPDVRKLLNFRPTAGRTTRAMLGGDTGVMAKGEGWKTFLDLVASKESESYGGYDAYNLGGSSGGHVAHGSGNSTDGRFGKPLSQLTVNDVVSLGQRGQVWAAGRYQFIPGTLRETIKEAGLKGDEVFNAETQDRLAVARARWRMRNDRGMAGLRREWIGLNNVSDAVLRPAMQGIVNDRSPYNKVENLSPSVANSVYTTGNIGPTSTGQHLDVKRTDGSYFEYKELNDFVDVQDKDLGRVPLGKVPETGDWNSHTRRGSHGRDYGTYSGSKLFLKNGAKVVSNTPTVHGDYMVIRLPDGREFSFLHGKKS